MNKKQKDLILQCAIDICKNCNHESSCLDDFECNARITLKGLANDLKYAQWDGESFGVTEEPKECSYFNPFS